MLEFLFDLVYLLIYYPIGMLFAFTHGLRIEGSVRIPKSGPVLIVANHQSYLDIVLSGLASKRRIYFLAKKPLWNNRFLGWVMDRFETVPVDITGFSRSGLDGALAHLKKGHMFVIFPEGERTYDGKLSPLKPGVSLLVRRVQAPIVPLAIAGAFDAMPRSEKTLRFAPLFLPWRKPRIAICVGEPIDGKMLSQRPREEMLAVLHEAMEKALKRAEFLRGNR